MTTGTRSSAARRLVARAARPAVRPAGGFSALQGDEMVQQPPPPGAPAEAAAQGLVSAAPSFAPPSAPVTAPSPAPPTAPKLTQARAARVARPPAPAPPSRPGPATVAEQTRPTRHSLGTPGPPGHVSLAAQIPPAAVEPSLGLGTSQQGELREPVEPIGWQGLADAPVESPPPAAAEQSRETSPRAPPRAREPLAIPATALQRPATSPPTVAPPPADASPLAAAARSFSGSPPTSGQPAAPPPAAAAAPGPPQVLIDRIEVITPPARAPKPDPLASLAGRRRAASRHARGGS